jgi:transposase-like protein
VRTVGDAAGVEHEVHLESYDTFASGALLADPMVAAMLAGLSGRRYQRALEPVGEAVEAVSSGTSQSAVSRRFIAATAERLAEFRSRPLGDRRWLIVFVDGFDFAGHTMVGALGVTADGTKVPLGVVEGSTENASVMRGLIACLRDRGLDASEGILFVLDGDKALAKAVRDVFGDQAVIARCRQRATAMNRSHGMRTAVAPAEHDERRDGRRHLRLSYHDKGPARMGGDHPPVGRLARL